MIESMIVLFVLSIVIGTALPSFQSLRQRADLAGVAAQLETDVQFARGQAARDEPSRAADPAGDGRRHLLHGAHRRQRRLQLRDRTAAGGLWRRIRSCCAP